MQHDGKLLCHGDLGPAHARVFGAGREALSDDHRLVRVKSTLAASYSACRAMPSPCLLIGPTRSVSPDW
jgi:hypothetical protein